MFNTPDSKNKSTFSDSVKAHSVDRGKQNSLHDAKLEILKEEIQKGLNSGDPTPLNMGEIRMKARAQFEASE